MKGTFRTDEEVFIEIIYTVTILIMWKVFLSGRKPTVRTAHV